MKTSLMILFLLVITPITESFAEEIKLPFGETISYENLKLYFYDIQDSRCPSDVTCIWEGKVSATIDISMSNHTVGGPLAINSSITFEPYIITLVDVEPYPISTEKSDSAAILEITKSSSSPDEISDEDVCGSGNVLINGICQPSKSIPSDLDLQRGESISNPEVMFIFQSLGAIMIVLFIIVYAIKKRLKNNEN